MSWTTIRHSGVPENTETATWRVGEKPHDPLDPGPYGTPGWRPDPRRGRHRRAELPDPPPVERRESMPGERRSEPQAPERRGERPGRGWFNSPDRSEPSRPRTQPQDPYDFSPLREAAYRDFLRDSEELHLAHLEPPEPNRVLVYLRWYLQVVVAILYWRVVPFPESPSRCRRSRAACRPRQTVRYIGRAAVVSGPIATDLAWTTQVATEAAPEVTRVACDPIEPRPVAANPVEPPAIRIEWRTAATPPVRRAPARRSDPPRSRPPVRPQMPVRPPVHRLAVMSPRNAALTRRRADTRRIFLHTYGMTRDQNLRNLTWPRGSWDGFVPSDPYANPRRGAIQRRRNHRPRSLALARSFPSTIPVVPVGATSRPAPVGPTKRLVPASATPFPGGDLR